MVQQKVVVHVQLVEHPAQGVLTDGQDAGVKPCGGKHTSQPPSLDFASLYLPAFCPKETSLAALPGQSLSGMPDYFSFIK